MRITYAARMARLDLSLLWRNRTGLFSAVGMPLLFGALLLPARGEVRDGVESGLFAGTGYLAFFLIFAVFTNLVAVLTTRREDLSLKRLRAGALGDTEILGGSVLLAGGLYLAQIGLLVLFMSTVLGGRLPANPLLLVVGLLFGIAVFALLAAGVSGITPNADMAQLTSMPILMVCLVGSGVMVPLDGLPEWVRTVAELLPLSPLVEIVRTAYFGLDFTVAGAHAPVGFLAAWAACGEAFAIFGLWALAGWWASRRWFRWEPRHG
ncbi:MAG: ABC transporter permease [Streptosporangiales bacterium]|nr:ABC transporter permease [Streptosporangiales bacterium]